MKIAFEESGTHVKLLVREQQFLVKIRLDVFPDINCKTHHSNIITMPTIPVPASLYSGEGIAKYIDKQAYQAWLEAAPKETVITPMLSIFLAVPENIKKAGLREYIEARLTPNLLKVADASLIYSDSAHRISPLMRPYTRMPDAVVKTRDLEDLVASINKELGSLDPIDMNIPLGDVEPFEHESIDIGPLATDRANYGANDYIVVDSYNPANATGNIDTFEIWTYNTSTDMDMGTFTNEGGDVFSTDDFESLGSIAPGAKRTYPGLTCAVLLGDYIGHCGNGSGSTERDAGTGSAWYENYPAHNISIASLTLLTFAARYSTYGTGTEAGSGASPGALTGGAGVVVGGGAARLLLGG